MKIFGASLSQVIIVFIWSIFMGVTFVSIGLGSLFPGLVAIAGPVVCPHGEMALASQSYQVSPTEGGYTLTWYCIDKTTGAKTETDFFTKHLVAGSFYGLLIFAVIALFWVRSQRPQAVPDPNAPAAKLSQATQIVIVVVLILLGVVVPFLVLNVNNGPVSFGVNLITEVPSGSDASTAPEPTPTPQGLLFSIDGSTTGAGHFSDVRGLSVDPTNGTLFAAEYSTGRVLAFDASGKVLTSWSAPGSPVFGLASDGHEGVFVADGDKILHYGATGTLSTTLSVPDSVIPNAIAVAPDGSLAIAGQIFSGGVKSAITRMSADGRALGTTIQDPFTAHGGQLEMTGTALAIDQAGNIYALGPASGAIFEFSAQGSFLHRFDMLDKQVFLEALAMDGQGHLYVGEENTVKVLDGEGGLLASLPMPQEIRGLAVGNDRLYVSLNDDQILVLNLPNP